MSQERKDFISKILVSLVGLIISALVLNNQKLTDTNKAIIVTIIILILLVIYFWEHLLKIAKRISSQITEGDKISELEKEKEELKRKIRQQYKGLIINNRKLDGVIKKLNTNKILEDQDIAELNEVIKELKNLEHLVQSTVENIERGSEILDNSPDTGRYAEEWLKKRKSQEKG